MKLIPVTEREPKEDMRCLAMAKRNDGSIYTVPYAVFYSPGVQLNSLSTILTKGFLYHSNVLAWVPWPEHYIDNKLGWILTTKRYPAKADQYFVSVYTPRGSKDVRLASYDERHERFYGCAEDVIAWMKIPKYVP